MRKLLLGSVAALFLAAPTGFAWAEGTAPAQPADDPPLDWTGFYVGLALGEDSGRVNVTDIDGYNGPPPFKYSTEGPQGAVQGGYNWWFDPCWLLGIEGEAGYFGYDGHGQYPPYVGVRSINDSLASVEGGAFATATGRVGVTAGRWLFFGKGGFAGADLKVSYIDRDPVGTTLVSGTGNTGFRTGFTGGGGVEFMFPASNWSARVEYDYYDFGSVTHTATSFGGSTWRFHHDMTSNAVTVSATLHW